MSQCEKKTLKSLKADAIPFNFQISKKNQFSESISISISSSQCNEITMNSSFFMNSTDHSQESLNLSSYDNGLNNKKKNFFEDINDKKKFVSEYQKKIKTELCKNWELSNSCKFADNCSFAHGRDQIQTKNHLHQHFKTRPCQQYFVHGYCNYGYRCQYLHSELKYYSQFKEYLIQLYLQKNIPIQTLVNKKSYEQHLFYLNQSFKPEQDIKELLNKFQFNKRMSCFQFEREDPSNIIFM